MKPPHGNRPGGSSRPPSDRGPYRGPGGHAPRPPGQGGGGQRSEARGGHASGGNASGGNAGGGGGAGRAAETGFRDQQKPRHDGPRPGGKAASPSGGARGEFQPRPPRDAAPQRFSAAPQRRREAEAPRHTPDSPKGTVWLYGIMRLPPRWAIRPAVCAGCC